MKYLNSNFIFTFNTIFSEKKKKKNKDLLDKNLKTFFYGTKDLKLFFLLNKKK